MLTISLRKISLPVLYYHDFYKQLKTPEAPVRYKRITVTAPYPPVPVSKVDVKKEDDKTTTTAASPSEVTVAEDDDNINMTVYYDNTNNLSEIYLARLRTRFPRALMQIIGYLAPSFERLTKITIQSCRIDSYIIYELAKTVNMSSITDICLDGSPVSAGNYFILLDHPQTRIKYLSLCRCNINDEVCIRIATRLHHMCPAERTLLLLNLSSNQITDEGAKCLGQALRTNRRLRYLNLADNRIGDDGASFIFNSLIEFRLTYDETMGKRRRRLEYLKAKNLCIMKFMNESIVKSSDELSQYSRKEKAKRKSKGSIKKEHVKKDKMMGEPTTMTKAELIANDILGPFVDPFCPLDTKAKDGFSYCLGNMVLCYLNLSYNRLAYLSIKKLLDVLQYQKYVKRISQTGLVKVVIEGNDIPMSCVEYQKINDLTRLAKSMHHFSGRMSRASNVGLKPKVRTTRISQLPQLANSGRN
ncbi:hypothetical protein ABMA27_007890 [Loxostege sticticalis]|uniref:Leucine-rich repeat-containing protein 71-like n=1 Tax=Loxostege sticticalis TaxID=481309 RepID=A0ABR3HD82_LOXSC